MRAFIAVILALTLALGFVTAVDAGPKAKPPKAPKVKVHAKGDAFCPSAALVVGNVVIASGRCYTVYTMRDTRGTFLAFADPGYRIPPGQIVRLGTPAGAKLKGRIFYLVPIRPSVVIVPMNSFALVGFRTTDYGPRLTLTLTGVPASVSVTFEPAQPRY
jgi:hypothetical protein